MHGSPPRSQDSPDSCPCPSSRRAAGRFPAEGRSRRGGTAEPGAPQETVSRDLWVAPERIVIRAPEEGEWVRDAQRGSAEAFERLFRSHWPHAYRAALLVVGDAAAAEDIVQESFLAAVRALDRFDRRRPFGPWLHRIVVNRAIDWARARALRRELSAEAEPAADEREQSGNAHLLAEALVDLQPEHRAVIVLRYLLEYTPGEIARLLGLPRGTVNSRLRRGLDRLEEAVREELSS
jgi:RNA polymerase sigma-70 factor (ECF subfamily)